MYTFTGEFTFKFDIRSIFEIFKVATSKFEYALFSTGVYFTKTLWIAS